MPTIHIFQFALLQCSKIIYIKMLGIIIFKMHTGFLKIVSVRTSMCVRLSALRLLITSGVIWTPNDWLNKFYNCYMATVAIIVNGCRLDIDMRLRH